MKIWTQEEEKYLREHYPYTLNSVLAKELSTTLSSVKNKAVKLKLYKSPGFHGKKKWTKDECDLLRELYPESGMKALCRLFNASEEAIKLRANSMGVYRSENFMAYARSFANVNLYEGGKGTRFKKGVIPWIKGKKGVLGANRGSFRKNRVSLNGVLDNAVSDASILKKYLKIYDEGLQEYVKDNHPYLISLERSRVMLAGQINTRRKNNINK